MNQYISWLYQISPDTWGFIFLVCCASILRFFIVSDITKKRHKSDVPEKGRELMFYLFILVLSGIKISSELFHIEIFGSLALFAMSIFLLSIISVFIGGKILVIYGEEVEVSGQKYFKRGYKASLFSLFVNALSFLIGVFLCIEIFDLDTIFEIGGLWAGILAFMGFTAPVWALDMIAGIILLQSRNYETGNIFYLYSLEKYVWIKSISLTEVKCIDLSTSQPVMFRPSVFRDMVVKNMSLGIMGKSSKIIRYMEIKVDFKIPESELKTLCYEAFDQMIVDQLSPEGVNYFDENPYRELFIESFGDYAVRYKFFYSISSPFYIFKAERLLNEYLLKYQQERGLYFSTPDLIQVQKKETL